MNKLFLLIFSYILTSSLHAEIAFQFEANKNIGLLRFVEAISGKSHRSELYQETFKKSPYNNEKYKALITEFKNSFQRHSEGFDFESGAKSRRNGFSSEKFFHIQCAYSSDLDDLKTRTLTLFPYDIHEKIFRILREFQPVYENLFWNDLGVRTKARAKAFEEYSQQTKASEFLNAVEIFYRANLSQQIPFKVVLHPLAKTARGSSAEQIGPLLAFETILDDKDMIGITGVLVHEVTHAIFANQSDAVQKELEGAFSQHSSPYKYLAYKYLDEGVATAIGNGIFVLRTQGKLPKSLYTNEIINGYGKALIPVIDSYLKEKKPWDQAFVDAAIDAFAKTFPDSRKKIDVLMNSHFMFVDPAFSSMMTIEDMIYSEFNVSSSSSTNSVSNKKFQDYQRKLPLINLYVVKDTQVLKEFMSFTPSDEKALNSMPAPGIYSGFDDKKRPFVIAKIEKEEEMSMVVKQLKTHVLTDSSNW